MKKNSNIYFLNNNEIDKQRWDECIKSSFNGLIYAESFYLDNLCPGWSALMDESYEWVLPVTHNKKWGISYLYQPPFTQQLGIFAKATCIPPYEDIIIRLQKLLKFWEINWNYTTDSRYISTPIGLTAATNFIHNLLIGYDNIAAKYHKHLNRQLKKSKQFKHKYQRTEDYDKYVDLYKKNYGIRTPHVKLLDYERLKNICRHALKHDWLICREVLNEDDELIALALLLRDEKRIYNLINFTTETGRKTQANHFLLDSIIREFSGRELLFDFEGSDLHGVKTFYEYFGPINQPYLCDKI